jgi:translation initiation factor 2 gamma subunit (eIF-2gamma)
MLKLDTIWTRRKDISEERLKICNQCEHFQHNNSKCKKCGCFMNYKTMLPYVDCPIGKWGIINTEESDTQENIEWKS